MKTIHLIPYAGLGNRMRVISSVYNFTRNQPYNLVIHWNKEGGLNASFYSLFQPVEGLEIRDSKIADFFLYNYPNKFNLKFPLLFDKLGSHKSYHSIGLNSINNLNFDKEEIILSTYSQQGELYPLSELFIPTKDIQNIIDTIKSGFSEYTVGCHIRRTDNIDAIKNSSLELFESKIESLFKRNSNAKIFLCTDDFRVKDYLIRKYSKDRILTYNSTLNRYSYIGIRDAVVELYLLASTDLIWGSFYSSYTEMASSLYGTQLEIIK